MNPINPINSPIAQRTHAETFSQPIEPCFNYTPLSVEEMKDMSCLHVSNRFIVNFFYVK